MNIPASGVQLAGDLAVPDGALGLVVFAHGSGSSRHSPRNRAVAAHLRSEGLGTLLVDLLTSEEEEEERVTRRHRFDIPLLARRLADTTAFVGTSEEGRGLPIGYFGASTGAAAALVAAAESDGRGAVGAVVSRGGRPDLAGDALELVTAPTLLIVGSHDRQVLELNRRAQLAMRAARTALEIVEGATHLFEEPGALDRVAELAAGWFRRHLATPGEQT